MCGNGCECEWLADEAQWLEQQAQQEAEDADNFERQREHDAALEAAYLADLAICPDCGNEVCCCSDMIEHPEAGK